MKTNYRVIFILMLFLSILSACTPAPAAPVEFRIALLPIMESLPIFVAEESGYFESRGVKVTIIPAGSAAERDQLMAAGQADGIINDLVSVVLYNKEKAQVEVVRFMRTASAAESNFSIIAAANSGLKSAADLAGVPIGISEASVIDYVTDRMLRHEGLAPDQIETVAVPKMADRMALLGSGELKAATLPEPFATLALQAGGVLIVSDAKYPQYGNSVFSVRNAYMEENPAAVEGFLAAINQAVTDINADPEKYRPLLEKNKLIPPSVAKSVVLPQLPPASVPSQQQFDDVVDWALSEGLISARIEYLDSVRP